jgi:hypothetical protein
MVSGADELDMLMWFLDGGMYFEPDPREVAVHIPIERPIRPSDVRRFQHQTRVRLGTLTDPLDAWFYGAEGLSRVHAPKPTRREEPWVEKYLAASESVKSPGWLRFGADLVGLSGAAQRRIGAQLKKQCHRARNGDRERSLTTHGATSSGSWLLSLAAVPAGPTSTTCRSTWTRSSTRRHRVVRCCCCTGRTARCSARGIAVSLSHARLTGMPRLRWHRCTALPRLSAALPRVGGRARSSVAASQPRRSGAVDRTSATLPKSPRWHATATRSNLSGILAKSEGPPTPNRESRWDGSHFTVPKSPRRLPIGLRDRSKRFPRCTFTGAPGLRLASDALPRWQAGALHRELLAEHHAQNERARVTPEGFVGRVVLSDAERRHPGRVPDDGSPTTRWYGRGAHPGLRRRPAGHV